MLALLLPTHNEFHRRGQRDQVVRFLLPYRTRSAGTAREKTWMSWTPQAAAHRTMNGGHFAGLRKLNIATIFRVVPLNA
jgi:hypothetical protein